MKKLNVVSAENKTVTVEHKTVGVRKINGTDFPVERLLQKDIYFGKVSWIVVTICNGIAENSKKFKTQKEAIEEYNQ